MSLAEGYLNSYTLCLNMVEVELREWGNSIGIILPSDKLKKLNLHKGDKVEIEIISKKRLNGFGISVGAESFEEEKEVHEEFW